MAFPVPPQWQQMPTTTRRVMLVDVGYHQIEVTEEELAERPMRTQALLCCVPCALGTPCAAGSTAPSQIVHLVVVVQRKEAERARVAGELERAHVLAE